MVKGKTDVIILSLAADDELFDTTNRCINSYIETADSLINNIFVLESNKNLTKKYDCKDIELIIPEGDFNYNKFFNIALEKCNAEFVTGPNNDIIIQPNCLQTIINEFDNNPDIASICPIDRNWHRHTTMYLPSDNKLYYGYEGSLHMFGCIFSCRRKEVFSKLGYLDEQFYFFYQDNDYVMSLERCNLLHGVHTGARVLHKSGHSNRVAHRDFKYTSENMQYQGELLQKKWNSEPFVSGGYKPYKIYAAHS